MKLKSCPFCGGNEEIRITKHGGYGINCICGGMFFDNDNTEKEVIRKWNNRPSPWVSVKNRLPYKDGKSSIYCLVYDTYNGIVVRPYNEYHKVWDTEDGDDYYCNAVGGSVTHYQLLPSPPEDV